MSSYGFEKSAPHASLHQIAEMLRSAVDAIISINAVGIIESVNPATEALFGYSTPELVGQNVRMLMPNPYQDEHDSYIRQYRQTGQKKIIGIGREVVGKRKDGSTFPMHLSVSEYEIDGRRCFAGIVHDLTAQRHAEIESRKQQTLFQAIINDFPHAIIISDQNHRISLGNPTVARIFGHAPEELIGKDSHILFASVDDSERVRGLRLSFDTTGEDLIEPLIVNCRHNDGHTFPAEIIATIIRNPDGNALGTMKLIRDVTLQAKQTEALRQAQRLDALGQLTGGIAHDFNNLLTIIIGNLELFDDSPNEEEARRLVARASEAALMGARLTGRLLSFARQRKLEPVVVSLNEHILNMMDLLRRSLGETIEVTTSLAPNLCAVRVDPSEIENAVLNLAINARDAMSKGGRLALQTYNVSLDTNDELGEYGLPAGDYACLSVQDSGSGMPPEVCARAFEPFFTTKPPGHGTGIGLASVYGFVKQSGGNATIYSEIDRGTVVRLYLPAVASKAETGSKSASPLPKRTGETVLVVEDNPDLRTLSLARLKRLGYRVFEAESGPAALAILDSGEQIDLLFSDVVMPGGVTGYELARLARARFPSIRILLTSGYDAEPASAQGEASDDLKLLRKPYKQADLARAMRDVLDS